MKAIICTKYGSPEVLQFKEVAQPTPKSNQVRIKIHATGVTASDCIVRAFNVPAALRIPMGIAIGFRRPRRPILGMVCAGEIDAVGNRVTAFKKGDAVFACDFDRFVFGMYAEYVTIPENGLIAAKPAGMTYEEAASLPYGGLMALHYLKKGDIQRGQNVLIYGASGAIGTSAVQLAKHFGATVTGVCSTRNLDMVRSLGADQVIDYTAEDFTKRGDRYDLILNAVGKRKVILQCDDALTPTGKHITVDDGSPKIRRDQLVFLKEVVETGHLKAVIDRSYPLENMVDAHRYVDKGHKQGNVAITVAH